MWLASSMAGGSSSSSGSGGGGRLAGGEVDALLFEDLELPLELLVETHFLRCGSCSKVGSLHKKTSGAGAQRGGRVANDLCEDRVAIRIPRLCGELCLGDDAEDGGVVVVEARQVLHPDALHQQPLLHGDLQEVIEVHVEGALGVGHGADLQQVFVGAIREPLLEDCLRREQG